MKAGSSKQESGKGSSRKSRKAVRKQKKNTITTEQALLQERRRRKSVRSGDSAEVTAENTDKIKQDRKRGNRQIAFVAYFCVVIFLGMIGYLVHFMVEDSQEIINNPYNKRQELLAERVVRGQILSADGKVLAYTKTDDSGEDTRVYPYGRVFCHVVGRSTNSMTGLELAQCFPLLTSHSNPLKQLANELKGEKNTGDNVVTTLDAGLQQAAYDALGSRKGAVVAIEPSTGKILAMVSRPSYDPNTVAADWDSLVEDSDEESALLNRATQGLYPPGSTFKLLTAIEYMLENPDTYQKYQYQCSGTASFDGNAIKCYGNEVHGNVDLQESLAHSCNTSFANIGTKLNLESFAKLCSRFGFNQSLPVSFEYNKSSFALKTGADTGEIIQTAIGQGKTTITPLQNAMIAATIANGGEMMTPYLVDYTENDAGKRIKSYQPKSQGQIIDSDVASRVKKMMKAVVTDGTATSLRYFSYTVAGKTGSAEIDSEGNSHAWFVGFAPAGNPQIAVSIIVEGAGTGSQYAVPIAKEMFAEYLGN